MSTCYTCGGEIGEHFGQCPEGAEAFAFQVLKALSDPRKLAALVDAPREVLRLTLTDAEPVQPSLFGGNPT